MNLFINFLFFFNLIHTVTASSITSVSFYLRGRVGNDGTAEKVNIISKDNNNSEINWKSNYALTKTYEQFNVSSTEPLLYLTIQLTNSGNSQVNGKAVERRVILNDNDFIINGNIWVENAYEYITNTKYSPEKYSQMTGQGQMQRDGSYTIDLTTFPTSSQVVQPVDMDDSVCDDSTSKMICFQLKGQNGETNDGLNQEKIRVLSHYTDGSSLIHYNYFPLKTSDSVIKVITDSEKEFDKLDVVFLYDHIYTDESGRYIDRNVAFNTNSIKINGRTISMDDVEFSAVSYWYELDSTELTRAENGVWAWTGTYTFKFNPISFTIPDSDDVTEPTQQDIGSNDSALSETTATDSASSETTSTDSASSETTSTDTAVSQNASTETPSETSVSQNASNEEAPTVISSENVSTETSNENPSSDASSQNDSTESTETTNVVPIAAGAAAAAAGALGALGYFIRRRNSNLQLTEAESQNASPSNPLLVNPLYEPKIVNYNPIHQSKSELGLA